MAGNSTYLQAAITNWFSGTNMPAAPTSLEVGLSTVVPNDTGGNITEPAVLDGYSRQSLTLVSPVHTEGLGTRVANSNPIIFGPAVNNGWGTIVAAVIFDDSGNYLFGGQLAAPRSLSVGDTLSYGVETLEFKIR